MPIVSVVAALAVIEYVWFMLATGRARQQYGIQAPATSGHPIFERHYRVQQNTIEQLVIFLPALFLFGAYVSTTIAALLGLAFIAGRFLYARGYVAEPAQRGTGFAISFAASAILLLGGLLGALRAAL